MQYDPNSTESRTALATHLVQRLAGLGFSELRGTHGERVFAKGRDGLEIRVYTTIVGAAVRAKDKDAIRVCRVYVAGDGGVRPLGKERRVHRTGVVSEIADRMAGRIDKLSGEAVPKCDRCGAPKFVSSKDNLVCAALCWKAQDRLKVVPEQPRQQERPQAPSPRPAPPRRQMPKGPSEW